jgi:multidrug resistance efflux pump
MGVPFEQAGMSPPAPKAGAPTPLPKRPKGRIAVGIMLLVVGALVGHSLWGIFFRYGAYGLVMGRVAEIASPWEGLVTQSHASEEESFQQNEVLAQIDSLELRHRLDRLGDELRMAQAELDAQISRIRWEAQDSVELSTRVAAQQHEAEGQLAEQQALLERYQRSLRRTEKLKEQRAITDELHDLARFNEAGQRQKVDELMLSVAQWKRRTDLVEGLKDQGGDQLAPQLARIRNLQAEIVRLRELLGQGQLRAPFDAVVVKRHKLVGERVRPEEPVVKLLQTGSLEVALYLSQDDVDRLRIGDAVEVLVEPAQRTVPCTVVRIGNQMEKAPPAIERFYWSNEPLLPVYLKPDPQFKPWMSLRLGSMVKW